MKWAIARGDLVFWKGFQFEDGGASDKLLIILGAKAGQNLIALLTASKSRGRNPTPGCTGFADYFFISAGGRDGFHLDTWVETYRPVEMERKEADRGIADGTVTLVRTLRLELVNEIRNCLKLSRDITPQQGALLE